MAVELVEQEQQAAALGQDRPVERADRGAQPCVCLQLCAEDLREAAGEDQRAGALGERLVAEGVEGHELGPGGPQQLEVLLVVERERRAARDGDAGAGDGGRARIPGRAVQRGGIPRQAPATASRSSERAATSASASSAARVVASRSPAGTSPRCRSGAAIRVVAPQHAEHGQVDRVAQQLLVVVGADAVEHDAGDLQVGVEGAEAVHDRRG